MTVRKLKLLLGCMLLITSIMSSSNAAADDVFDHPQSADQLLKGVLAKPAAALQGAQVMRGKFTYKKYLKELPQPLVSSGEFVFAPAHGIDWHTRVPFDSEIILTAKGMVQKDAGRVSMQSKAADQPAIRVVAKLFLALLSLDMRSLEDTFAMSAVQQRAQWQVGLKPIAPAMAAVFQSAVVSGADQVQTLVLRDASGERTEISFDAVSYAPVLPAADAALFVIPTGSR